MVALWKLRPALTAICLIFAFSGPAFSSEAVLRGFLDQLKQRGYSATMSGVSETGRDLAVTEIVIRSDGDDAGTITLKDVSASKLEALQGGGIAGDLLRIAQLDIAVGGVNANYPDIVLTGFSLPKAALLFPAAPVKGADAAGPAKRDLAAYLVQDIHAVLEDLSLAALSVGPGTITFSSGASEAPINTSLKSGALTLSAIRDQVLDRLDLASVEIESTGPEAGSYRMVTGAVSVSRYDLGVNARAVLPEHYKDGIGDMKWHKISGPLVFETIAFTGADGTTRVAKAAINETRVRQLARAPRVILDNIRALDDKALAEGGAALDPFEIRRAMSIFRPMSDYVGAVLEGVEVTPPDAASTRVETIMVDRFSSVEGIGSIHATNIDIRPSSTEGSATLGKLSISDVQFPEFAELAQSTEDPAGDPARLALYDPAAAPASTIGGFAAEKIVVKRDAGSFEIGEVVASVGNYVKFIPTATELSFRTLSVPLATWPGPNGAVDLLKALGYETLVMNGTSKMRWEEASETVHVEQSTVSADALGDVTLEGAITGISRAMLEQPQAATGEIDKLKLQSLRLTFADKSFINRFATYIAGQTGTSPDEVKAQYGVLATAPLAFLQNPEFQAKARAEVAKFLADPKSLTISAEPIEPQSLIGIFLMVQQLPSQLVKALNLDIRAE